MSSAHIFYIPIALFIGLLAGFYLGRRAAQDEARELRKRRERRKTLRDKKQARKAGASDDKVSSGANIADEDPADDDARPSA